MLDPYATLYVTPDAPDEVIRAAYRVLAKIHHPDTGGSTARMAVLTSAYHALRDRPGRPAPHRCIVSRIVPIMPWGKHEGLPLSEVPVSYLRWLRDSADLRPWLRSAIGDELDRRPW